MKPILLAALLAIAQSVSAAPATDESVETLLSVTKAESMVDAMLSNLTPIMRQGMAQALSGKPVSPAQQQVLDAMPAKFTNIMRDEMSWSKMKPQYIRIYQESFSQEDVEGFIAFYRSPAGQSYIDKMPIVMQKSMAMGAQMSQNVGPKMKAAIDQALKDANISR